MEITAEIIDQHFKANDTFLRKMMQRVATWFRHQAD